ncbi:MAG: MATE family efflux transporter [Methanobrevibacter sp.]|uniref:MATE family efflux transporter n=1 Tax=Methanobrevibacter sp. TaxID=66852 RepID=UPI0026DFA845|nr:MATE family efflux transporter [Methanobrevibacter sp.]MDO5848886.1 MATE family efflux transporter [Methanobrevibacter sp.]
MAQANEFEEETHKNIEVIRGEPKRAIRKLALPMALSMLLIMLYNLADSIWVSGLGADALAAIGFITPLFMIIIGLGNGIGAGANSLIARAIGAKNKQVANNAALHSILISTIIGIVIPIILIPLLPTIITIMGGAPTMKYAMAYSYVIFGLMIVFIFASVMSAILRSEGDVNRATIAIAITAILNIVLDPIFIYSLNMGIAGAAWATILSSIISCIVMFYWMWIKKDTYMDLELSNFKASKYVTKEILKVAIPSTAEQLIISLLVMCINAMLVIVSTTTQVAIYTATMRIVQMAMIPLMGLGTALLTVGGAAYGARNYKKMNTSFTYTIKVGFIISIILGAIMIIFAPQLSLLFSYSAETAYLTDKIAEVMRIMSLFLIFMPFGMAGSCIFQGVGRGTTSLIITVIRSLIGEVILAYTFGIAMGLGYMGIYSGLIVGSFIGSMIGFGWAKLFIRECKKLFGKKAEN